MTSLASHQLINQSSGAVEYYTPAKIIDAAREVLDGRIDLDPASSPVANAMVGARKIFTQSKFYEIHQPGEPLPYRDYHDRGGLSQPWPGNVWLNPPFGNAESACNLTGCQKKICLKRGWHSTQNLPGMSAWVGKFIREFTSGNMASGLMICFASTSESWFQPLLAHPQCFLTPRTNYLLPDGTVARGVSKGSVVTYLGPDFERFKAVFSPLGAVK